MDLWLVSTFLFLLVCICDFESIKLAAAQKLNVMFKKKICQAFFVLRSIKLWSSKALFSMPHPNGEGTMGSIGKCGGEEKEGAEEKTTGEGKCGESDAMDVRQARMHPWYLTCFQSGLSIF